MLSRRLLRIKVVKALFAHLKSGADNMIASEKTLMTSVDKAYDLYFQILILPVESHVTPNSVRSWPSRKNCRHTKTSTPTPNSSTTRSSA